MRFLSQTVGLERLRQMRDELRSRIAPYEERAKNCLTCETQGACCLDAHFVNVHISRLEAVAIAGVLATLPAEQQRRVAKRTVGVIEKYGLSANGDTFEQKFACPLYEKSIGCLVHQTAKPVPCIVHACYENKTDLPPDEIQAAAEKQIDALNTRVYGRPQQWLPLPLAINKLAKAGGDA